MLIMLLHFKLDLIFKLSSLPVKLISLCNNIIQLSLRDLILLKDLFCKFFYLAMEVHRLLSVRLLLGDLRKPR